MISRMQLTDWILPMIRRACLTVALLIFSSLAAWPNACRAADTPPVVTADNGLKTIATINLAGAPPAGATLPSAYCNRTDLVYDVDITATANWDSSLDTDPHGMFVLGRNMHDLKPNSVSLLVWGGKTLFARMTSSTTGDTAQVNYGNLDIKPGAPIHVHARWTSNTISLDLNGRRIGTESMAGTFEWPQGRAYFVAAEDVGLSPWNGVIVSGTLRVMEPIIRAAYAGGKDAGYYIGSGAHRLPIDLPAGDGLALKSSLSLYDINGVKVFDKLKPSVVSPGAHTFELPTLPFGWYQAVGTLAGHGSTLKLTRSLVITPGPVDRQSADLSPFGITEETTLAPAGVYDPSTVETLFTRISAMGVRWYRLWVPWDYIQTAPNQYDWRQLDDVIARARSHGLTLYVCLLGGSQPWQSSQNVSPSPYPIMSQYCYMPLDMSLWSKYVGAFAQHCKGRVFYYQVWNEPDARNGFYPFLTGDYVTVVKASSAAIRAADPRNLVGLGGFAGGFGPSGIASMSHTDKDFAWGLGEFWSLNPQSYYDIMDCHFYTLDQPGQSWDKSVATAQSLHAAMQAHADGAKPLWNSETSFFTGDPGQMGGWTNTPLLSGQDQAARLVQMYVQSYAAGISHTFWYSIRGDCGVLNTDFSPLPSYAAQCELARMMYGLKYQRALALDSTLRGYVFNNGSRYLYVLWTTSGDVPVTATTGAKAQVLDIMGNLSSLPGSGKLTISTVPVYITSEGVIRIS